MTNFKYFKFFALEHPSNYNIAIREDGKEFRVGKHIIDYCERLPKDHYVLIKPDDKHPFGSKYFNWSGMLKEKYWALERIR